MVYCMTGQSRTPTLLAYFLMEVDRVPLAEALQRITQQSRIPVRSAHPFRRNRPSSRSPLQQPGPCFLSSPCLCGCRSR